jgi:hypothetical protein
VSYIIAYQADGCANWNPVALFNNAILAKEFVSFQHNQGRRWMQMFVWGAA